MARKRKSTHSGLSVHWPVIVLGTAAIALVSGIFYIASRTTPPRPGGEAAAAPVFYNRAEDATPFPVTLDPATFKRTDVKESLLAGQMHREGKSPQEIRAAIILGRWKTVGTSTQ